jgi:hypothetical protein
MQTSNRAALVDRLIFPLWDASVLFMFTKVAFRVVFRSDQSARLSITDQLPSTMTRAGREKITHWRVCSFSLFFFNYIPAIFHMCITSRHPRRYPSLAVPFDKNCHRCITSRTRCTDACCLLSDWQWGTKLNKNRKRGAEEEEEQTGMSF